MVWSGQFLRIRGELAKVFNTCISKSGKHGHAKIRIMAVHLNSKQVCCEIVPTSHSLIGVPQRTYTKHLTTLLLSSPQCNGLLNNSKILISAYLPKIFIV